MATNPETVVPQTPERDPLAVLRDEGRAKMVAALRTRKATLQQIKDIAKEHSIEIENEDALKENIAYTRIPGSDLSLVGEFIFGSTPPQEAPAATISQYDPTFQEQAWTQIYNAALSLGADKSRAQYFAERLAGRRGGDISLLELTPAAALTDVPTGIEEVQRGLRFDEPGTAALGALQTGLGLLEAVPVVGAGVKAAEPTLRQARNVVALADVARRTPTGDASRQAIEALSPSQVPPTPTTPMARIAQAPEIPPTRITFRTAAAAPEAPVVIEATPQRRAAAETVLEQGERVSAPQDFGLVDRAGNINLTKLPPDANLRETIRQVSFSNKDFIDARRGVMSVEETADLADKVGLQSVIGRRLGQAFNAEEITAARRMVRTAANDAVAAAGRYIANPQDANLRETAISALVRQIAIQEQLAGAAAEAGRALRALRELDDPTRRADINAVIRTLRFDGKSVDPDQIDVVLKNLAEIGDNPDAAGRFVASMREPDFFDKVLEFRVSALLAGPQTQSKNILSNALMTLTRPFEEAAAAGFGKITRGKDAPTFREVAARTAGLGQGLVDGLRAIRSVYRGEDLGDVGSKIELPRRRAIGAAEDSSRAAQIAGAAVRTPLTALEMADEFFKAVNRRSHISALAYRQARAEAGKNKNKFTDLYAQYLENPTASMKKEAQDFAREQTFQTPLSKERILGNLGKRLQSAAQDSDLRVLQFAAPFIRTPVNLAQAALDRMGLTRTVWRDVIKNPTPGAREAALGKLTMGYGTVGAITALHQNGYVTGGGPSDYQERLALMQTGWQPYSFKINDTYYSYEGIEPFATIIGLTADMNEISDDENLEDIWDISAAIAGAVASNLTDKTFTRGISEVVEMWQRPEIYGETFLQNFIASFVPNIAGQTARAVDPTLRQTDSVQQAIQSRIPGLAEDLPARLDAWGDPLIRTGYFIPSDQETGLGQGLAVAYNLIFPIRISQSNKSDPVRSEVARLGMALPRIDQEIRRTIPVRDRETGQVLEEQVEMKMTQETLNQLNRISGRRAYTAVQRLINTPIYRRLNEDQKQESIRRLLNRSRQIERDKVFVIWAKNQFDGFSQKTPE